MPKESRTMKLKSTDDVVTYLATAPKESQHGKHTIKMSYIYRSCKDFAAVAAGVGSGDGSKFQRWDISNSGGLRVDCPNGRKALPREASAEDKLGASWGVGVFCEEGDAENVRRNIQYEFCVGHSNL
ncbi:hypothetical protein VHEMI04534 [[Torrubiella] hemipterigena]|uniref:Uncharacterized protein n=1 Tax=[Torrubiella] hemipterigena TaxID=1531966 RepID=A0A0A1TE56_9HYPO|nr:hypothetical protein VHEMI04534 [[Torrubiella] hemipterigena]